MEACAQHGIEVGVELPCEPDKETQLFSLLDELTTVPVTFINLNELEITVGNQENMDVRGFNLSGGITATRVRPNSLCVSKKRPLVSPTI